MGKNVFWYYVTIFVVIVTAFSGPILAREPRKPLGAWFGEYELLTFNDKIVWPLDLYADTHYAIPVYYQSVPGLLDRHSALLVGNNGSSALTKAEIAGLQAWVAGGGVLVLTGAEGPKLFGAQVPSWVGAQSWWSVKIENGSVQLLKPGHPLAKDLDSSGVSGLIGWGGIADPTTGVSIIGRDNVSFLLVNSHGKGYVVYLGGELCPQSRPKWLEKTITRDLSPLAVQVWKNLIVYFSLPTRSSVIEQWAQGNGKEFAVWWRYEKEKPLGGALYFPPFPKRGEELPTLTFNVGMGERCWKYFFVTNALPLADLKVTPTDLTGRGNKKIPADALTVYVQERPFPDYPKAPYWLVEPQYVEPLCSPAVRHHANRTTTWWVKLRCVDVVPGDYTGTLEFRNGPKHLANLPVKVKVWPLYQPGPDVLHYGLEHFWFGMPGGFFIRPQDPKLSNPDLLAKYMEHLAELGVDFGQSWSDVAQMYCLAFVRLKENGILLKEALSKDPDLLKRANPPHLDFSGYDSIFFDNAIKLGLTKFAMYYYEASPLTSDRSWWWSEYATYLKERGYLWVYTKILDEIGVEMVDEIIKQARAIRPAGFRVYTTTYNFPYDAASVAKIDPWLDLWQWCCLSKPWDEIAQLRNISWDPNNELWGTTTSSYWGNYIDYARGAGWSQAWRRYEGLHTFGYMRWFWNDHEGALPGPIYCVPVSIPDVFIRQANEFFLFYTIDTTTYHYH